MRSVIVTISILALAPLTRPAAAAGGVVIPKTTGSFPGTGYYFGLSGTGVDRFITTCLSTDAPPLSTLCGARIGELTQGILPPPGALGCDLRFDDPANPGYPDLSPAGLIATADPASLGACSSFGSNPRLVTFGGGAGIPWPGVTHYLTALEPLHGVNALDFCGLFLDTTGPPLGFASAYD